MAVGSLFVGSGSGKVGNLVLANTKQGQVTRVYQPNVSNPKTSGQIRQRAKFANAVKFFKQATAGFFRFAFEDKKSNESDYNAFMRHNIRYSLPLARELYLNPAVLALGDKFQMASGRLQSPATLSFVAKAEAVDNGPASDLTITLPAAASAATVGAVSTVLINAGLQAGDIITIVRIESPVGSNIFDDTTNADEVDDFPHWTIVQFVLDETDTTPLTAVPATGYGLTDGTYSFTVGTDNKTMSMVYTTGVAQWGAIVVTRKTDSILYSSDSYLQGDTEALAKAAAAASDAAVNYSLNSWGVKETAILKGSIAFGNR